MPDVGADEVFRLSGVIFSRTSTRSLINGVPYTGIIALDFSSKREGELVPGQRQTGRPLGITDGLYMPDSFSLECLVDTAEQIKQQLGAMPGANGSFGSARFSYLLQIAEKNRVGMPNISYSLEGMKIEGGEFGLPTDQGKLTWKFTGKFLLDTSKGEGAGLGALVSFLADLNKT